MTEPTCETCRWWINYGWHNDCRKNAPICEITNGHRPKWPSTSSRDFCGEHQPKEKKDD